MNDDQSKLEALQTAVRSYLSHLWEFEQGSVDDGQYVGYWLEQMTEMTGEDNE